MTHAAVGGRQWVDPTLAVGTSASQVRGLAAVIAQRRRPGAWVRMPPRTRSITSR